MNRDITLYRVVDNRRVPFVFTVDKNLTILNEEVDRRLLEKLNPTHTVDGVSVTRNEGEVVITSVSKKESDITRFFTPTSENPFPGVRFESLRNAYFEDKAKLEEDPTCPTCEVGRLIRSYRAKLDALLKDDGGA